MIKEVDSNLNWHISSSSIVARDNEIAEIEDALLKLSTKGKREILFVYGPSGVGKTKLANYLCDRVISKGSIFGAGKCDQYHKSTYYDIFIQILRSLFSEIISKKPDELRAFKSLIKEELGRTSGIIQNLVPELGAVIKSDEEYDPSESFDFEATFKFAVSQCFKVFAQFTPCLVLYFDDIQWIDQPSAILLQAILRESSDSRIMFVFSYRDDEVKQNKEALPILNDYWDSAIKLNLGDFTVNETKIFLKSTLGKIDPPVDTLAPLIHEKTKGNAFYVRQLIQSLILKEVLVYDEGLSTWLWNINGISKIQLSDNVADFVSKQFEELDEKRKNILFLLSCFGSSVPLNHIEKLYRSNEVANLLRNLVQEGYLLENVEGFFSFSHDRIKQAVYSNLSKDKAKRIHWDVSRLYAKQKASVLEQCAHIMKGFDAEQHIGEARTVVRIMNDGIAAANESIAYGDGVEIMRFVRNIFEKVGTETYDEEWNRFIYLAATVSLYSKNKGELDEYLDLLNSSGSEIDYLKALEIEIKYHIHESNNQEAFDCFSRKIPKQFYKISEKDSSKVVVLSEVIKVLWIVKTKGIENILNQPEASDERIIILNRIIGSLYGMIHSTKPDIFPVLVLRHCVLLANYGITPEASYCYMVYAMIMGGYFGRIDLARSIQDSILNRIDKLGIKDFYSYRSRFIANNAIKYYAEAHSDIIKSMEDCAKNLKQLGDDEFQGHSLAGHCYFQFDAGEPLSNVITTFESYKEAARKVYQRTALIHYYRLYHRAIWLTGGEDKLKEDSDVDFYQSIEELAEDKGMTELGVYCVKMDRQHMAYMFGNYIKAFEIGAEVVDEKWANSTMGAMNVAQITILAGCKLLENVRTPFDKKNIRKVMKKSLKILNLTEKYEDGLAKQKMRVVYAELERLKGNDDNAEKLFKDAIYELRKRKILHELAIALECYLQFRLSRGVVVSNTEIPSLGNVDPEIKGLVIDTIQAYDEWGAVKKSEEIVSRYSDILANKKDPKDSGQLSEGDYDTLLKQIDLINKVSSLNDYNAQLKEIFFAICDNAEIGLMVYQRSGEWNVSNWRSGIETDGPSYPDTILNRLMNGSSHMYVPNVDIEPGISKDPYIIEKNISSFYAIGLREHSDLVGMVFIAYSERSQTKPNSTMKKLEMLAYQAQSTLTNSILIEDVSQREKQISNVYNQSINGLIRVKKNRKVVLLNETFKRWFANFNAYDVETIDDILRERPKLSFFNDAINVFEDESDRTRYAARFKESFNGETKHYSVVSNKIVEKRDTIYDFSITDITESVNSELEKQKRKKAEKMVEDSSDFLASVSHELRTPLSMILRPINKYIETCEEGDVKELLVSTQDHTERLLKQVNDLLEFTPGSKAKRLETKLINLSSLTEKVAKSFDQYFAAEGNRIFKYEIEDSVFIKGIGDDIARVILNLVYNAFKYTSAANGEVGLELKSKDDETVQIIVKDNGIGIPENEQPFIFDRFFKSSNRPDDQIGLGIGLSLVKELVKNNLGKISFDSVTNEGTTFKVSLSKKNNSEDLNVVTEMSPELSETEFRYFKNLSERFEDSQDKVLNIGITDRTDFTKLLSQNNIELDEIHKYSNLKIQASNDVLLRVYIDLRMGDIDDVRLEAIINSLQNNQTKFTVICEDDKKSQYSCIAKHNVSSSDLKEIVGKIPETRVVESSPRKILIVDDEPEIRKQLSEQLSGKYNIILAKNGKEALELISLEVPDVVLLDLMMPVMDGFSVLEKLDLGNKKIQTKVCVLTAKSKSQALHKAFSLYADEFLDKAVSKVELIARIESLLHSKKMEETLRSTNLRLIDEIDHKKQAESLLILSEKNKSVSHISRSVLHDIRNPVNTTIQSLNYAKRLISKDSSNTDKKIEAIQYAVEMQRRVADILDDLSDFAALGAGTNLTPMPISGAIDRAIALNQYELSGVNVNKDIDGLIMDINESQIIQVFTNFITNSRKAFKHTKEKRPPEVWIQVKAEDGRGLIKFRDNGSGISEASIEKIFDDYYSDFVKNSSGLGLPIVKSIIESGHGGTIQVDSDGSTFTEFTIYLPLSEMDE